MAEEEVNGKGGKMEGVKLLLFDIEGTVCPISYVKDTLFPYATKALPDVLAAQWDSPAFQPYRLAAPEEARKSQQAYVEAVNALTAANSKIAWLKNLQGYLWEDGYKTGAYSTPLFPDVAPCLKRWEDGEDGLRLAIYSSGSVFAQKLLFAHVQKQQQVDGEGTVDATPAPTASKKRSRSDDAGEVAAEDSADAVDGEGDAPSKKRQALPPKDGEDANAQAVVGADKDDAAEPAAGEQTEDLTGLFEGWFDTTNAGPKTEAKSYEVIAGEMKLRPEEILFFSDNVKEIEAAEKAQMKAVLVDRPGNAPLDEADVEKYHLVKSFDEVEL